MYVKFNFVVFVDQFMSIKYTNIYVYIFFSRKVLEKYIIKRDTRSGRLSSIAVVCNNICKGDSNIQNTIS